MDATERDAAADALIECEDAKLRVPNSDKSERGWRYQTAANVGKVSASY
jgi:hypothetical protein